MTFMELDNWRPDTQMLDVEEIQFRQQMLIDGVSDAALDGSEEIEIAFVVEGGFSLRSGGILTDRTHGGGPQM